MNHNLSTPLAASTMAQGRVLIVDDDRPIQIALRRILTNLHMDVLTASTGLEALSLLEQHEPFDLVLLDVHMPGQKGTEVLGQIRSLSPLTTVMMMTGVGCVKHAVQTLKEGASDYILKPFDDIFDLCQIKIRQEVELSRARRSRYESQTQVQARARSWDGLLGASMAMRALFSDMEEVLDSQAPVLLQGDTGTGKLAVAHALHAASAQRERTLTCVDCSSLSADVLELLLFGGQRTAHVPPKTALLRPDGGPLYLSEVSTLPLSLQGRMVQCLQDIATSPEEASMRLYVSSSVSLVDACEEGSFRRDLYYRLSTLHLRLPRLQERQGDIASLAEHFLRQARPEQPDLSLHPDTLLVLEEAPWHGNVRELRNAIERAVIFASEDQIMPRDLPDYLVRPTTRALSGFAPELVELDYTDAKQRIVADFEQRYLTAVMELTQGNISQAARHAGMDRSNFRRLLKRHDLS